MEILFSSNAKTDLSNIVRYISRDKPQAARKWAKNIKDSVKLLANLPYMGRIVPEFSDDTIRELIKGQYRVVYKIDEKRDTIVILTVHHSKRPLV